MSSICRSRVSIRKTFEQFLLKVTKYFACVMPIFCAKNLHFVQSSAKPFFSHNCVFHFCAILIRVIYSMHYCSTFMILYVRYKSANTFLPAFRIHLVKIIKGLKISFRCIFSLIVLLVYNHFRFNFD